ncbi:MAG: glycoside hydrolase family 78 protein [Propionibacteriaceae bacterium]|jgi:alpha-L-rhamnosidase|nr:glycoside hydrolase family 78 protein [Propionibacteriaceae bacterium]
MPQWKAQFISSPKPCEEGDPAPYFRKTFDVEPGVRHATVYVTALGVVEAHLNGSRIGDAVLAPGWTAYRERLMVAEYDVTDLLSTGPNVMGAIVGEGWAVGALTWNKSNHHYADRPALFMQLEIEYADRTEIVSTAPSSAPAKDSDWVVGPGGVRANGLYDGEVFDAQLEQVGWAAPGYDATAWWPTISYDWPMSSLRLSSVPPIRRIEELAAVEVTVSPTGYPIIDFGQNISGWVHLTLNNPRRGQDITIRHAEALKPDGALERETNRTALATDRYIAAGHEREEWEPRFTIHGFRYIEVEGWRGLPSLDDFRAVVVHSDMDRTGWFESSDAMLNRLHENAVWSMRDNFVGIPTDCPQRDERLGWTGDVNVFIASATYLYDVEAVLASWLSDLMIEQRSHGVMPRSAPLVDPRPSEPTALWGDAIVNVPWMLYQEYGRREVLRRCWPAMRAFVDEVATRLDPRGLWNTGFQYGDWADPDAPAREPGQAKTDKYLVAQAYLARTTDQMVRIAELLGEDEAREQYVELDTRVRLGFQEAYVTQRGIVKDETATGYALAICFGLLTDEQQTYAGKRLRGIIAGRGHIISSGFAGIPFVTDALTMTGHLDTAYAMLFQTQCPSFMYPVTMGATTFWERWDAILPDGHLHRTGMTSLNHYALGAISDWVRRVVGGLSSAAPGWSQIVVAPRPGGGLTTAETSHVTPLGLASVKWQIRDGEMVVTVVVPDGATARIVLPDHPEGLVATEGPGEHEWAYPLRGDH